MALAGDLCMGQALSSALSAVPQAPCTLHAGQYPQRSWAAPHWWEHWWQTGDSSPATPSQYDANPWKNGMGTRGSHGQLGLSLVCASCNFLHLALGVWLAAFGDGDLQPCMPAALPPLLSG